MKHPRFALQEEASLSLWQLTKLWIIWSDSEHVGEIFKFELSNQLKEENISRVGAPLVDINRHSDTTARYDAFI